MGYVQKDALRTTILSYIGVALGYLNKGVLFLAFLSTSQIGLISLMVSIGTLFAQVANFGTVITTLKFLPYFKNKERNHHGFLTLMLIISTFGVILFTVLYFFFRPEIEAIYIERSANFVHYYFWVLPIGMSYVLFMVLEAYLKSFYKNIVAVFSFEIGLRISITLLLLALWLEWISFDFFVVAHSAMYAVPPIILLIYLQVIGELNISFSSISIAKRFQKIIFGYSAFNYVNTLGAVIIASLDIMMIAHYEGLEATGVFGTVIFLISALQVPYRSLIRVSSPLVADAWKAKDFDSLQELYRKTSSVLLVIALTAFLLIWLNIDFLFSFLKPEFQAGIWVFLFIMLGRMLDMYFGINGVIFKTSKKYRYDLIFTLFIILSVFFLNVWLIPLYGIAGAAIGTGASLVLYNLGRLLFVGIAFKIHPFHGKQFMVIVLALVTLAFGIFIGNYLPITFATALLDCAIVACLFLAPIYFFNLEKETVNYVKNGVRFVQSKLKK